MKRTPALLVVGAALALLPGCYFVSRAIPLDAKGMEYPAHVWGGQVDEQVENSSAMISDLPENLSRHCRRCWRNLSEDPSDF